MYLHTSISERRSRSAPNRSLETCGSSDRTSQLQLDSTLARASMSDEETLSSVLDLCRRLPPQNVEANLDALVAILPDLADDLLSSVDQPLKVQTDSSGREYLVRHPRLSARVALGRALMRAADCRCATTTAMGTHIGAFNLRETRTRAHVCSVESQRTR